MTRVTMQRFAGGSSDWDSLISRLPKSHLLQTWEWAQVKEAFGWEPTPLVWIASDPSVSSRGPDAATTGQVLAAAMVLQRPILRRGLAAHLSVLYVPKGPLLDWADRDLRAQVLRDLEGFATTSGAIFLKIDPDVVLGTGIPGDATSADNAVGREIVSELTAGRWAFSREQIQFRNTVLIDLAPPEADMLRRMKQKTRYNIRLAEKKGVTVRVGNSADVPTLYRMYAETSGRDGFVIRSESYYKTVWETFMQLSGSAIAPWAEPLIADVDGQAVAALFLFYFGGRAYYIYGMSREVHREKMPNHLLQWAAIKRARARGCSSYDLWGAPDEFNENDSMWGVFRFKEGLGGEVVRTLGAWDFPAARLWYPIYTRVVPRLLDIMRASGRQRTRQDLAAA